MSPSKLLETLEPKLQTSFDFPEEANTANYARSLDSKDPLKNFREQFVFPSKVNLVSKTLTKVDETLERCIYLCGNSLGLQPKPVAKYLEAQLNTWATLAVHGHFTNLENSPLTQWQLMAEQASECQAAIVGASPKEIATMGSLTSNLHTLLASFYKPTETKHKIIMDWKAFPSDHYVIESQITWHGLDPKNSMVFVAPTAPSYVIPTSEILSLIDTHASETALILLPGIQYYSGQFFDIETITKYAQEKGIVVGWDLAHAAGNVPLQLHDWNVDFAAWCTYKYMNSGPGSISGLFVHERHGEVDYSQGEDNPVFRPRLTGWYGHDTGSRFKMDNKFKPTPGASGYQLSNPSIIDLASLLGSLSLFNQTTPTAMRQKSLHLTAYLQHLLLPPGNSDNLPYRIITPLDPEARGAQLSILLDSGLLEQVDQKLRSVGIVADVRKPGVIRVAPVPLYNSFEEVWLFVKLFREAMGVEN